MSLRANMWFGELLTTFRQKSSPTKSLTIRQTLEPWESSFLKWSLASLHSMTILQKRYFAALYSKKYYNGTTWSPFWNLRLSTSSNCCYKTSRQKDLNWLKSKSITFLKALTEIIYITSLLPCCLMRLKNAIYKDKFQHHLLRSLHFLRFLLKWNSYFATVRSLPWK